MKHAFVAAVLLWAASSAALFFGGAAFAQRTPEAKQDREKQLEALVNSRQIHRETRTGVF